MPIPMKFFTVPPTGAPAAASGAFTSSHGKQLGALFKSADGRVRIGTKAISNGEQNKMVDGRQGEQRFPNWSAVMPKESPRFTITVDAAYLARLAKNAAEFMAARGETKPLRLQFTDAGSAVWMDCSCNHEGQQWTAILMPMRGEAGVPNPFKDVPECVDKTASEETRAANKKPCSPADADAPDGGGKRRGGAAD